MAKPTGKVTELDLRGYFIPKTEDNTPVLLEIPSEGDGLLLPIFSTPEAIAAGLGPAGYETPPAVVQIEDPYLFLLSIPDFSREGRRIRIVVDIHAETTDEGKIITRFHEVDRAESIRLYQSLDKSLN